MRIWSSSTILQLINSIAVAIAQAYMLVRSRLASYPSPVLRVTAERDAAVWNSQLLERELAVYRQERQRMPPRQRWHYTPAQTTRCLGLNDVLIGESVVSSMLHPWQLLIAVICGWVNRHQQHIIDLQNDQLQTLLKAQGKKCVNLRDEDRRCLAVKAKRIGRKALLELTTIVTPDTILRWHRQLVAQKWNYSKRRKKPVGRPAITSEVKRLVLRMARENPEWGYDRISGEMGNLGHVLCDQSVGNILQEHGIEPAPQRKRISSWKEFISAHWDVLAAVEFTTIEVGTCRGLVTYQLLFVMDLSSRRVEFAGMTPNPTGAWMDQVARNLTDCEAGFLRRHRCLLMDRDTKSCQSFRDLLEHAGVKPNRLPARSPNFNAHIERFMRSLKDECLNRMIFFGEWSMRNAVNEFLKHYHHERNHQGVGNAIIDAGDEVGRVAGTIKCRQRLGGLLKYYHRKAA